MTCVWCGQPIRNDDSFVRLSPAICLHTNNASPISIREAKLYEGLWDAVDAYRLWEPGRRGYAAARRELDRVWRGEEES